MKKVIITMEGGIIQDIEVPSGVEVVVMDYDTEGIEPERLRLDSNGVEYLHTVWYANDSF